MKRVSRTTLSSVAVGAAALLLCGGCLGQPNAANVELRKQNQQLQSQLRSSRQQHQEDAAIIAGLQARLPTEKTLPPGELSRLVTTAGIRFGRLTGGVDLDPAKPGDEGIKVYVVPFDSTGQVIKAAGSITVEAYDLAAPETRIGKWTFDLEQARRNWYGYFLIDYYYALTCPWQTMPTHRDLTIKVTFLDELTKLPFTAQKPIQVTLPYPTPASEPTAQSK